MVKIVIAGGFGVGKTTFVGSVSEIEPLTTEAIITRFRMAASPPDVLVEFPLDMASAFDFHRAAEMIEIGRSAAQEALAADPLG